MTKELKEFDSKIDTLQKVMQDFKSLFGLKFCIFAHGEWKVSAEDLKTINLTHEFNLAAVHEYKKHHMLVREESERLEIESLKE